MSEVDVDVLVVGSGAAGLSAALAAAQAGAARVLVAEAEGVVGGSSRLSGGLMMGAGTRYQRAAGIEDDGDRLFRDYLQLNRWNLEVAAARRLAREAGDAVEWLGDMGLEFHPDLVYGGDEPVPRVHVPIGRGQAVVDLLAARCRDAGVDIALGRRVDRLLTNGDGAVCGVAVGDDEITAHAVVVASGGFGHSLAKGHIRRVRVSRRYRHKCHKENNAKTLQHEARRTENGSKTICLHFYPKASIQYGPIL